MLSKMPLVRVLGASGVYSTFDVRPWYIPGASGAFMVFMVS